MKKIFIPFITILLFANCNSPKNKAVEQAEQIQNAIQENKPGYVPTSADGFFMKATIDGKKWEATSMMPPEAPARIVGDNNGEGISLPYDRRSMVVGDETNFENSAVDLFLNDDVVIWGGHKGQMKITKVDEKSAEGTFYFTASGNNTKKTIEVTDGFFRILFLKK